jgi:Kef-type K+ transport system membrane component KefB
VAIGILMFISSISGGFEQNSVSGFFAGGILILTLFFIGYFILPKMTKTIAKNQELLFLFSICWCFVLAALFSYIGFSMEIGARKC